MEINARWWVKSNDKIRCNLCPHHCVIAPGRSGLCGARMNVASKLVTDGYGTITAAAVDPIEKKPLYHFYPGESVFSVGFAGCNFQCPFCQNHRISGTSPKMGTSMSPDKLIAEVLSSNADILAFTYSEPTIHPEYLIDCASLAHHHSLKTVLVTNGGTNPEPTAEILENIDAVNIDLKSWNEDYYHKVIGGDLSTVKAFISIAKEITWLEITSLIVPDDNDNPEDMAGMCEWIATLSPDIPLHLSAYHPAHKYRRPGTAGATMSSLFAVARKYLNFVYVGNMGRENDTCCPNCDSAVIKRQLYSTQSRITKGRCPDCGTAIPGIFH